MFGINSVLTFITECDFNSDGKTYCTIKPIHIIIFAVIFFIFMLFLNAYFESMYQKELMDDYNSMSTIDKA
jgi:hypothetical protein